MIWIFIFLYCLFPAGCDRPGSSIHALSDADIAALEVATAKYRDAEAMNDWETVTTLYTENAIRMLPKGPTIQGREAILAEFKSRPSYILEYDQRMIEAAGLEGIAFVRGVFSYVVDAKGKTLVGSGKYIAIYREQMDGSWLIDRDIFNYDEPDSLDMLPPN